MRSSPAPVRRSVLSKRCRASGGHSSRHSKVDNAYKAAVEQQGGGPATAAILHAPSGDMDSARRAKAKTSPQQKNENEEELRASAPASAIPVFGGDRGRGQNGRSIGPGRKTVSRSVNLRERPAERPARRLRADPQANRSERSRTVSSEMVRGVIMGTERAARRRRTNGCSPDAVPSLDARTKGARGRIW